ncbi:hypothetical protein F5148DRAFT_1182768 [Russula earlei]|uniref:Uncharacterized protein n=1 Tax=Russula earlei TaxID=71964 RepID=A0ACC0UEW3_9AGAM|nr:hypothetical protein F5148DRAFT_1182768 [Russula earlei]
MHILVELAVFLICRCSQIWRTWVQGGKLAISHNKLVRPTFFRRLLHCIWLFRLKSHLPINYFSSFSLIMSG